MHPLLVSAGYFTPCDQENSMKIKDFLFYHEDETQLMVTRKVMQFSKTVNTYFQNIVVTVRINTSAKRLLIFINNVVRN
jgi:hypothetical protein